MTTIPIAEIFGPTVQGEGSLAGRPTYFVRVGGCDFKCAWCDTGYAVNPKAVKGLPRMTQDEIIEKLWAHAEARPGPDWLSISGGNPALYDLGIVVTEWRKRNGYTGKVTLETQGSKWTPWLALVDQLTISPKPPSSGMTNGDDFAAFMASVDKYKEDGWSLKVVVFDDADYDFAVKVHQTYPAARFYLSCGTAMGGLSGKWVPPLFEEDKVGSRFHRVRQNPDLHTNYIETKDELMERWRWLVEKAVADPRMADVAIFPQMHALLWGISTKGV